MTVVDDLERRVCAGLTQLAIAIAADSTGVTDLVRLSGGATQEIWRFALLRPGGPERLILRRAPGGHAVPAKSAGLDIEARLLAAAADAGVPVPPVVYTLKPADGLGEGFIMRFIDGETLGGRIVKSDIFATARLTLARDCGAVLAKVHSIDPAGFPMLSRDTPAGLVESWRVTYQAQPVVRPVFEAAFQWLRRRAPPPPSTPSLIHGDFRNGNLMIGAEGIRAVLDWELAHVGDPMEDLGWLCVNSWRFGQIDKPVGGFGNYEDLYSGYEAAGCRTVDRASAKWWEVFGTLRWGVICAGGVTTFHSTDPDIERAMIARRASETEIDLLRLITG